VAPPSKADLDELEKAHVVMNIFAPVAQGFIDAVFAGAALGKAVALTMLNKIQCFV
jgi:hypothetical protein